MSGSNEIIITKGVEVNMKDSEIIPRYETTMSMEQKSVEYIKRKESLRTRYAYGFIFLLTNFVAWFIRDFGHKVLPELHYLKDCGIDGLDCIRTRESFVTSKLHEKRNTWHSRWWPLKFVLLVMSLVVPFFCPSVFIQLYGELARIGAGIFLLLQLVSVIEFISWWNNYWMPDETAKQSCFLGLLMSTLFYVAALCGIAVMYPLYAPKSSCALNIFFITWTAILLIVIMVLSLHSKVNRGHLSSGIMASYIVFLCWSAIKSEPVIEKCSPQKEVRGNSNWVTVLGFLIAVGAIVMATFSTGLDSKTFQFRKDESQQEDDIPYKYGFFHIVFSLGAMYFAMLFINWDLDSSTRKWSIDVGWASTWIKIVNEWLAATIYLWKLISPVVRQAKVIDQEEPMQHPEDSDSP